MSDVPDYTMLVAELLKERHIEREKAATTIATLRKALEWYGEQARLCRLIHGEGDKGRNALAADGGAISRAALQGKEKGNE